MKEEVRQNRSITKKIERIGLIFVVFFALVVLFQDLLIFPGVIISFIAGSEPPPPEVTENLLEIKDGRKIDVWALPVSQNPTDKKKVAVIFHGNGGDVRKFYEFQKWFRNLGYTSYDFDYPGYGKSTGWMNESKIYQDAESVVRFVAKTENIPIDDIVIFGISVGSGPSAYAAQLFQSKTLIIASGYSSIPDVVSSRALFWFLSPFVRYNFPTASYLEKLHSSCVVISHGKKDEVIPYENGVRLNEAASKANTVHFISSEVGRHNDTFWEKSLEIKQALRECTN